MKFSLSWDKLLGAGFYLLVFAIPFGTRKLIWQFTEGFHEYTTTFVYLTDLILATLFLFALLNSFFKKSVVISNFQFPISKKFPIFKFQNVSLVAFLFLSGISIFFAVSEGLAVYQFVRLLALVSLALMTAHLLRNSIVSLGGIFSVLGISAVFQSLIAFAQFIKQGSAGLAVLGESFLNTEMGGVAKITAEGVRYLRAYGTLPHPNVLGAFLVIGLISVCVLWLQYFTLLIHNNVRTMKLYAKSIGNAFLVFSIAIIILGIILTFSRAAWLVAVLSILSLTLWGFINKNLRWRALTLLFIFSASAALVIAPIRDLVFTRAEISAGEPAVTARLSYNDLALELIKDKPWGVGIGNQVLYSVKNGLYQKFGMDKVWQWQPIHNLYLLIATELGWAGLLSFIGFIIFMFLQIANRKSQIAGSEEISERLALSDSRYALIMLLALLILGFFDHYLWTIQAGRLLMWLVVGMNIALMTSPKLR